MASSRRRRRCRIAIDFGVAAKEGDRIAKKQKGRIGSSFDDFLKEDGIYESVTARAIKRVIARQLDALMREKRITKTALAKSMKTSRAQLDRLLDPEERNGDPGDANSRCARGRAEFADGLGVTLERRVVKPTPGAVPTAHAEAKAEAVGYQWVGAALGPSLHRNDDTPPAKTTPPAPSPRRP